MNLIPSKIIHTESSAERKLFEYFRKSDKFSDSYVFHSLNLAEHSHKREGEIDFLIVGKRGVFAIEVKGGRIARRGNLWIYTNRYGTENVKKESPFDQAKTAIYSLQKSIVSSLGSDYHSLIFGYGVAFPDIEFDILTPEWSPSIIFDEKDGTDIDLYLERLFTHWEAKTKNGTYLSSKQVHKLVEYLRGDFNTIRRISSDIKETESQLIKLTRQQALIMESIKGNPRIWIEGSAGTGKTLLAYEQIRRLQLEGVESVYVCFNRLLASYIKTVYESEYAGVHKFVTISTVHNLFINSLDKNQHGSILNNTPRNNEFYSNILPVEITKISSSVSKFKYIIIDEAQDVFNYKYIEALESYIDGGWDKGKWSIFLDIENQKNLYDKVDVETVGRLSDYAAKYVLSVNCRNTREIALEAELVSGLGCAADTAIEGLPVKRLWYSDAFDQASKLSEYINNALLENGVDPSSIAVLSPKNDRDSIVGSGRLRLKKGIHRYDNHHWNVSNDEITACSISGFKGLERSIVIVTDIETMEGDWISTINYVGFTRASSLLIICANIKLKKVYQNMALVKYVEPANIRSN